MSRNSRFSLIALLSVLLTYWACGLSDPKYVNYVEADIEPTPPVQSECETEALGIFVTNLQSPLVQTCASGSACHSGIPMGGATISATSAEENRSTVKAYAKNDAQAFFDYLSGNSGHGGGNQSDAMPLAVIKEWTDKEAECDAEG